MPRLWRLARLVAPGRTTGQWAARLRFLAAAAAHRHHAAEFVRPGPGPLGRLIAARPEMVGALIWPYLHAGWDAGTRLCRIREHYAAVAAAPVLDLVPDQVAGFAISGSGWQPK
ncbi:MAG: VirK/YbjX family protein [Gemmataceae bacterium]|nr:VirK/YbjX family protein [Gemmataceae bacterium]